jgi:hypothetical protein
MLLTCHVYAIQKDAFLSYCNLPGYPARWDSKGRDTEHAYVRRQASIIDRRLSLVIQPSEEFFLTDANVQLRLRSVHHIANRDDLDIRHNSLYGRFSHCLAIWVAVKQFSELQRASLWAVQDCFMVQIKTHVFYFRRLGLNLHVAIFSA